MSAQWMHSPKCPVRLWNQFGRGQGHSKPKCICKDEEKPSPDSADSDVLEFRMPEHRKRDDDRKWCPECGRSKGWHALHCPYYKEPA